VRLLLDTHALLWWLADDARLAAVEREAIRNPKNEVYLSAASVWEIVIKQGLGRLKVPEPVSVAAARLGFRPLPITFEHVEATGLLPSLHRDPFDRLLVAQAKVESLTLVTRDPSMREYPGLGFLPQKL
jgi:PIN domain nuclease of toxin-antitoxin system